MFFVLFLYIAVLIKNEIVYAVDAPVLKVLATVNIYNATSTQENNKITISFDITNRVGVQPGVKYAVMLVSEKDNKQTIIDEYVYDEVLNLGEHSSIHKTVVYEAPPNLEGKFKVIVFSKNINGFPLSFLPVGDITLIKRVSIMDPFNIDTSSCFLTVQGETGNKKYTPDQGVDISSEENLESNCIVRNNSNVDVTIQPYFVTRIRSNFGDIVTTTGGSADVITLGSLEEKIITTVLPKASTPQIYSISLSYGKNSNSVIYKYVIQGGAGTIQNVVLDKNYYKKGEYADVSFVWNPPFDSFHTSRKMSASDYVSNQYVSIVLLDKNNKPCNDLFTQNFTNKETSINFKVKLTSECLYSKVDIKLFNKDTNYSDEASFENATTSMYVTEKDETPFNNIVSLVALSLALFSIFLVKKRKFGVAIFLMFIFSSSDSVKADTVNASGQNGSSVVNVTYNISLDKSSYSLGETITAYSSIAYSFEPTGGFTMDASINGSTKNVLTSNSFTAPSSSGSYSAGFSAGGSVYTKTGQCGDCEEVLVTISGSGSISYNVAPASCGAYSGLDSLAPTCVYNLNAPTTANGESYTSYSVASPSGYTGSRTWNCNNGAWSPGSYTCTPPAPTVYINFSSTRESFKEFFTKNVFESVFASMYK